MAGIVSRTFDSADETRAFKDGKGKLDLLNTEQGPVGRAVFEPGWRWSTHVKPIAGTDSCMAAHVGYVVSGRMTIAMDDGETVDVEQGQFISIAPGHDAYVVGDQPCVMLDWYGFGDYAKS
ncbi:cupin domain-containing protein [Streptomyces sp. NPDC096176]|uniref:cupin domain-containing protein n=1 Tax=Streptomyces sp. NPDC096176 TaxID=3366079 RepID=UPI003819505B